MILLGAGASIPFNIPTMKGFTDKFNKSIGEEEKHTEFINKIQASLNDSKQLVGVEIKYDLESLLTLLTDLSKKSNNKPISAVTYCFLLNEGIDLKDSIEKYSEEATVLLFKLREFIFKECMKPIEIGNNKNTFNFLDDFYGPLFTILNSTGLKNAQPNIKNIFSTNWDICFKTWMDFMNLSFSDGTFLDDQKMPILDINQLIVREPLGINYISIHGSLDLTEKSRIRGEGYYKEIQKIIDPRGYFKGSNLNELFMIYPLEVGGYSDSIKSPYLDMLYYFRKMMEASQCLIIMGYSLRDPTISSIIEEVITKKIRSKDLKPLSKNFEERISQAHECNYKLLVFTRNPENIKQNLEKMGLNNIGQTFIPITSSFPIKIVNEAEPYFNDKYDEEYKKFLSDLLQKLLRIQYVNDRKEIDNALEKDYNIRI